MFAPTFFSFSPPFRATGATGVFRAAIGMAAAPQRGANPPFFPRFALKAAKPSVRRRAGSGVGSYFTFIDRLRKRGP